MQKDHAYYTGLLSAYIDDRLTPLQVEELFAFIQLEPMTYRSMLDTPAIRQQLADKAQDQAIQMPDATGRRIWEKLEAATGDGRVVRDDMQRVADPRTVRRGIYRMMSYAAAVLVLIAGIYLVSKPRFKSEEVPMTAAVNIPPGTNKAMLTLSGGQIILLDSGVNGQLATQGATIISKNAEGQISYDVKGNGAAVYNTLTTPRGGQYQLILPDGTKVWVNAASSITYPTVFNGKERKVTVTGEAYFDIAHNKNQPFIVEVQQGPTVQVLGTQFNLNAYPDEPSIRTTLIDGGVKVLYDDEFLVLQPGQQAALAQTHGLQAGSPRLILDKQPKIDEVLAWKNGAFLFTRTPLDIVLRQLSRWYDIEVVYTKGIPSIHFEGEMKRDLNLSEVLNILRKMEVHCKMEGRRMIVLP